MCVMREKENVCERQRESVEDHITHLVAHNSRHVSLSVTRFSLSQDIDFKLSVQFL